MALPPRTGRSGFRAGCRSPPTPFTTGPESRELATPWPRFLDVEDRPAKLTVIGPRPVQLDEATGAVPITPERPPGGLFAAAFRVEGPEALGRLRWQVEPPRVSVQVLSQLTINPGAAEWVALVRYDVSGGPVDAVHLKLPTAWADRARVRVIGDGRQLSAEPRGRDHLLDDPPRAPLPGIPTPGHHVQPQLSCWPDARLPRPGPAGPGDRCDGPRGGELHGAPLAKEVSLGLQPIR